jgi:antitoxin component HigA of HigAB toxin-antitoxin module
MEEMHKGRHDLIAVFGSERAASEVLSGNRKVTKLRGKRLAKCFGVPVGLGLSRSR